MGESGAVRFSVFSKPWRVPLPELGRHVRDLGFTGVELPVRPGFPISPERVSEDLPGAARVLADYGVQITSVAGPTDEATVWACAEAGVPLVRTMVEIGADGYLAAEARAQRAFDALLPVLERSGVALGVQNHCDRYICHALGLRRLLEPYDPRVVCAVWDAAHNALQGEDPELAIELVWPWLRLVNLKNAVWERGPGAPAAWRPRWTSGLEGLASWPRVVQELKAHGYAGVVCLSAEYSDEAAVDRLARVDLAFARSLFA